MTKVPGFQHDRARASFQGYVDERSTHHVAGWMRNLADPNERLTFELVLPDSGGDDIVASGPAGTYSATLESVGVGDGRYAFRHIFDAPLTIAQRDRLFARPAGSLHRLELAPNLRTDPPPAAGQRTDPFQGYIDARSTRHVAGWVRNLADPHERVAVEIVLGGSDGEIVLWRGVAGTYSAVLTEVGVGDGCYSFFAILPTGLSAAERDRVFVQPVNSRFQLELAPALQTEFQPISHIALDLVDNCNLRCPFCVYDYAQTNRTHFMSDELFDRALQLIPFVTEGNFWLSCLHEATLHPRLLQFIERVPAEYRHKLFYTTNLAKRMPPSYFAAIASAGLHHLNISLESLEPNLYERMRKGARFEIFQSNWANLLTACSNGSAPPRLRYNIMAYRSNLAGIRDLVRLLLDEKRAWQVEIRHTYDEPHIAADFRDREFLSTAEWGWLAAQLSEHPSDRVVLLLPPGGVGHDTIMAAEPAAALELPMSAGETRRPSIPKPLNISMSWDGGLRVYGEEPRGPGQPPAHVNYVTTNIAYLDDPVRFLLAL
jgi:hypothetical protein